jgi:hypothetical protein
VARIGFRLLSLGGLLLLFLLTVVRFVFIDEIGHKRHKPRRFVPLHSEQITRPLLSFSVEQMRQISIVSPFLSLIGGFADEEKNTR